MSKTFLCLAAVVIVVGLAILAGRRAGRRQDDEPSSNQGVPLSEFPQVSDTTIFLDEYGGTTGVVSTSSTSTLRHDYVAPNGSGREEPETEDLSQSDEERTMSQELRQGTAQGQGPLVHLQIQILGIRAVVDVSRRSLPRQKSDGEGKSRCA